MTARGPDGAGEWIGDSGRLILGHRRLSIIDLDERAAQPMLAEGGRLAITFNGEIYNHEAIRRDLETRGRRFRTTSDTEVLLHLYALEGPDMIHALRGMYAFAIWDEAKRGLFLARDPYGIKPLYYADDGATFRFASQVKALRASPAISSEIDTAGAAGFLIFGSVPDPFTLFRDIRALPPGSVAWVDESGVRERRGHRSLAEILAGAGEAPRQPMPELVRDAVLDSVRRHLVADVEVGAFLSAGIDSGALVGLMRDAGQADIRTITLAFDEFRGSSSDEAPLAAQVAQLYGTQHCTRRVAVTEFEEDLPSILEAMDQPSIDGINTWFVSKAARALGLKVVISGLGGDELLAGYSNFRDIPRWVRLLRTPSCMPLLGKAARAIGRRLPGPWAEQPKMLGLLEFGGSYAGAYLLRRALLLPFELDAFADPRVVTDALARLRPLDVLRREIEPDPGSPTARVAALEAGSYMRNQLLRDADWAGMAHSLEIRVPLVDYALFNAMAPAIRRMKPGEGKLALAQAPSSPLPNEVIVRTKTGFGVPTGRWIGAEADTAVSKGQASRRWAEKLLARFGVPAGLVGTASEAAG